jgi:murein tripeptide amidase MpaA
MGLESDRIGSPVDRPAGQRACGNRPSFDSFFTYEELTRLLRDWSSTHASILELESIGTSHEGRDIWLATITRKTSGAHFDRPALWIDANIHATELTGSVAAMHLIWRLLSDDGSDPVVTRVLDTRTVYVVPCQNPDGAEAALGSPPRYLRSSTRAWPIGADGPGLSPQDVDGDGRILFMRVADPNGAWEIRPDEPRLLAPRREEDLPADGVYYRLLPEGLVTGYDGHTIPLAELSRQLDLNRNYPFEWAPASEVAGAGPYPLSEPEVAAVVKAITERPNICGYVAYHTAAGCHMYPYGDRPESALPPADRALFRAIARRANEITGYAAASTLDYWKTDDRFVGTQDDWAYDHLGIAAWTTEFWNLFKAAGVALESVGHWGATYRPDGEAALLRWSDEIGHCFVDWYEFEHPQLGPVELGGWDTFRLANPPSHLLKAEVAPHTDLALYLALITPRIAIVLPEVTPLGPDTWRVMASVQNEGWMPTNVSQRALERKLRLGVQARLDIGSEGRILAPDAPIVLGELAGRIGATTSLRADGGTPDRAYVRWIIQAPAGATVTIEAHHPRAGTARVPLELPAS